MNKMKCLVTLLAILAASCGNPWTSREQSVSSEKSNTDLIKMIQHYLVQLMKFNKTNVSGNSAEPDIVTAEPVIVPAEQTNIHNDSMIFRIQTFSVDYMNFSDDSTYLSDEFPS